MRRSMGFLLIGAGVLSILIFWNPGGVISWSGFSFDSREVKLEESVSAESLSRLKVETGAVDVRLLRGSEDEVKVYLNGKASPKYADNLGIKAETQGDTLVLGLQGEEGFTFGYRAMDIEMSVELPEKQWKSVHVEIGSGNIDSSGLRSDFIGVKAGSGDISLEDLVAREMDIKGGSGDAFLSKIESDTVTLELGSGDIEMDQYTAGKIRFKLGSGDVELADGQSELEGITHSGNIRLEASELLHNTELKTGSGDVTVKLSEQPRSLAVDFAGGSGEGKVNWKDFHVQNQSEDNDVLIGTFGSGDIKLKVETGSGNFRLEEG